MNIEIQKLENELSNLFKNNCLPDINTYPNSSFYKSTGDSEFIGDSLLFVYVKFEDGNKNRHWSLAIVYNDIQGYNEDKHIDLLDKNIRIFKSIYKNI